jgi:hypothetical protein
MESAGKTRAAAKLLTGEYPENGGFFPHYWRTPALLLEISAF